MWRSRTTASNRPYRHCAACSGPRRTEGRISRPSPGRDIVSSAAVSQIAERASDDALEKLLAPHRAWVEGRAALETLERDQIVRARRVFEGVLEHEPAHAPAHVGLANACIMQFEMTRADERPDMVALEAATRHSREACRLAPEYGEAWATLGFVLDRTGRHLDALAASRRAVALEPDNWRHHFRLAYVGWGEERLRAAHRTLALLPGFAQAHWLIATVHVARHALAEAERELAAGIASQPSHTGGTSRFSAVALHWLRGLIHLARDENEAALDAFERELACGRQPAPLRARVLRQYAGTQSAVCGFGRAIAVRRQPRSIRPSVESRFTRSRDVGWRWPGMTRAMCRRQAGWVPRTLPSRGGPNSRSPAGSRTLRRSSTRRWQMLRQAAPDGCCRSSRCFAYRRIPTCGRLSWHACARGQPERSGLFRQHSGHRHPRACTIHALEVPMRAAVLTLLFATVAVPLHAQSFTTPDVTNPPPRSQRSTCPGPASALRRSARASWTNCASNRSKWLEHHPVRLAVREAVLQQGRRVAAVHEWVVLLVVSSRALRSQSQLDGRPAVAQRNGVRWVPTSHRRGSRWSLPEG